MASHFYVHLGADLEICWCISGVDNVDARIEHLIAYATQ